MAGVLAALSDEEVQLIAEAANLLLRAVKGG